MGLEGWLGIRAICTCLQDLRISTSKQYVGASEMARLKLRELLPKSIIDSLAMMFVFVMIPVAYVHGMFYVTPTIWPLSGVPDEVRDRNWLPHYASWIFQTVCLVNGVTSLFLMLLTDTSCGCIPLPVVSQPGWTFCPYCQYYTPPRAYHCPVCQKCILRRDHHCYFTGKCVGLYNHRYFISFLAVVSIAGCYAAVLNYWLLSQMMGKFSWTVIPSLAFPIFTWLFNITPVNPVVMCLASCSVFVCFTAGLMLAIQLGQIYSSQTFWELKKRTRPYNHGALYNIRDVLGVTWWLAWITPFVASPLPNDGSHYPPLNENGHVTSQEWSHERPRVQEAGRRKMVKNL